MNAAISIKSLLFKNTLLKNFSVLTVFTAINQFFRLFISVIIARSLDPELFGKYNLLHLQFAIFTVIASLGLRNIIIRNIARDNSGAKDVFFVSLMLRGIGLVLACLIFGIYYYFYKEYDFFLFSLVVINIFAGVFFDLFESVAFGLEKMEFSGIINLAGTLLFLAAILIIPHSMMSLQLIYGLFVFFFVLKTILYYFIINKRILIKKIHFLRNNIPQISGFFKESFPYYYLALLTLLSNQIPVLFLQFRSGVEQIGFFNIANKVLIPINLVITAALSAIYPHLAKLFQKDYRSFLKNVKMIFILLTLFNVVAAFCISLFRIEIVHLLYGDNYSTASLVLVYQIWYVGIYGIVCLIGTILGAIDRQRELGILSIVCTLIQLPILWIGSKGGGQALAGAFLISTSLVLLIHFFVIRKILKNDLSLLFLVKILLIFVSGYFAAYFIPVHLNYSYKILLAFGITMATCYYLYIKNKTIILRLFNRS